MKISTKFKKNILIFIFLTSLIFMAISYIEKNIVIGILSLTLIFVLNLSYALFCIKNRSLLFFFLISFFTFTMGQYYFPNINNELYYSKYSDIIIVNTLVMQYISLFAILFGYLISNKLFRKYNIKISKNDFNFNNKIVVLFFSLFIFSFLCSCITYIETAYRVIKFGYLVIYNGSHPTSIPYIITYLGNNILLFLVVVLIISSNRKIINLSLILYFVNILLSLASGVRSTFIIGILFIFYYLTYYQKKFKIFKLKHVTISILLTLIVTPLLIVALNIYNTTRNNISVDNINVVQEFKSFFINQGTSVNVISNAQKYESNLNENGKTNFVLGPMLYSFENKMKIFSFGHVKQNNLHTLEGLKKNNLGIALSINVLGYDRYQKGHGIGSQYIAELYLDYGLFGILIFNFLLAIYMSYIEKFSSNNWIILGLNLLSFTSIVYISRGQTMQLLTSITSINFWSLLYLAFFVNYVVNKKMKGRI